MEIGFPFMGDRLSLCRYSWAKRLTVYSFIFSFPLYYSTHSGYRVSYGYFCIYWHTRLRKEL